MAKVLIQYRTAITIKISMKKVFYPTESCVKIPKACSFLFCVYVNLFFRTSSYREGVSLAFQLFKTDVCAYAYVCDVNSINTRYSRVSPDHNLFPDCVKTAFILFIYLSC